MISTPHELYRIIKLQKGECQILITKQYLLASCRVHVLNWCHHIVVFSSSTSVVLSQRTQHSITAFIYVLEQVSAVCVDHHQVESQ